MSAARDPAHVGTGALACAVAAGFAATILARRGPITKTRTATARVSESTISLSNHTSIDRMRSKCTSFPRLLLVAFRVVEPHPPRLVRAYISSAAQRPRDDLVSGSHVSSCVLVTALNQERITTPLAFRAQRVCFLKMIILFDQFREVTGVTSVRMCFRKLCLGGCQFMCCHKRGIELAEKVRSVKMVDNGRNKDNQEGNRDSLED